MFRRCFCIEWLVGFFVGRVGRRLRAELALETDGEGPWVGCGKTQEMGGEGRSANGTMCGS